MNLKWLKEMFKAIKKKNLIILKIVNNKQWSFIVILLRWYLHNGWFTVLKFNVHIFLINKM